MQELRLRHCRLRVLPAICSALTGLACITCTDHPSLGPLTLPVWLSRLTNLRRLECKQGPTISLPTPLNFGLHSLDSLVSSLSAAKAPVLHGLFQQPRTLLAAPALHVLWQHILSARPATPGPTPPPQDIGSAELGAATRLLPQLTQLTFGNGEDETVDLGSLQGG